MSAAFSSATLVVVGAGPAGLVTALTARKKLPNTEIVVLDKARGLGHHNLSGAVLEPGPFHAFLDLVAPDWRESGIAAGILGRCVEHDDVMLFLGQEQAVSMRPALKIARSLGMGMGGMLHEGDPIVSISRLTAWLGDLAEKAGIEILHGFPVRDLQLDATGSATGVRIIDQGLDRERRPLPNFRPGETFGARALVLAEGPLGYATESFIRAAGLKRENPPLFSVGVKEIIEVSAEQYKKFGDRHVLHALGWPLWTPVIGPGLFGGGLLYSMGDNRIAVGLIVGADWRYHDFIPQDAYARFKEHAFIRPFIEGGKVIEAGAKMIPEGGYHALPREPGTGAIGKGNVVLVGDGAGFVNIFKIKGLHNAIASGMAAGLAVAESLEQPERIARTYTRILEERGVLPEMRSAHNFRQTVARLGNLVGLPASTFTGILPRMTVEPDYKAMTQAKYPLRLERPFDKDAFVAAAHVEHREDQPVHCEILDPSLCATTCPNVFERPCIGFCPAGVYEVVGNTMKPANPTNCVHCKTCQNKCPYDNLRWHPLEGGGGPQWEGM